MTSQQEFTGQPDANPVAQADTSQAQARRILIVEDDVFLALLLEDQLAEIGFDSLQATNVAQALVLVQTGAFDAAILDIHLTDETIYPVATALRARNIAFAFSSGSGRAVIIPEFRSQPTLEKPYTTNDLQRVLNVIAPPLGLR